MIDYNGHGTGVAGVVGAVGNNSIGIAGICWNVSLVSLKITDGNTGYTSFVTNAINYATTNNIKILNLSSSISSPPNSLITAINNYDGIILCAAGNNSKDIDNELCPYKYPSILPNDNIISVAATKYNESLFSTSNYGNISVDIGANGYAVFTTNSSIAGGSNPSHPLYIYRQETSFATPQVTGIAALIKSKYPTISYKGIRSAILGNATQINALNGKVSTGGVVNAQNALSGVTNHKFTVIYYKNGGTGTSLPNTTIFYGIPSVISSNTYTKNNYSFVGWTAYRSSDNKWLYDNNGESEWYTSGSQPSGAEKHVFFDESVFQHESNVTNDYINLYAQWAPSDTLIGDVNLDGRISIQDANKIQQFLYGIIHLNNTQRLAADFNLDKRIDENDITAIQNYLVNG